jgi:hypothetical protein
MRVSTLMPTIITAALILLFLIFSSLHYHTAYSQLNSNILGSQNFSSLMKNLLGAQKQVSGHYSNPQFGIADIVFPDGWSGREMPPILGLSVIMHPGSENQSSSLFGMSSIPFAQPQMMVQVVNNSDVAAFSSEIGNPQAFSISKVCKPLAQNTTSVIDGRTFNVATIECPLSSLRAQGEGSMPSMGTNNQSNFGTANGSGGLGGGGLFRSLNLNPNAVMQAKFYEFKTPDKTYRLGLIVSNLFSSQTSEKPDISKYTQLLDTTANTLKFR